MKRKIIQIVDRFQGKDEQSTMVALADDGTVWEGCKQLLNWEDIKKAQAQRNVDKVTPIPAHRYGWVWDQITGLPDDNSNLGKEWL